MGHQFAGANSFPVDFTIPDDGNARNAAAQNVGFEALADRTIWLKARLGQLVTTTYDANTAGIVIPINVVAAIIGGYGGGGGGGGGAAETGNAVNNWAGGGGGGGGALYSEVVVGVTPGQTLTVGIGAGGAGGVGGSGGNGADGNDGSPSLVTHSGGIGVIARFPGAQGGGGGMHILTDYGFGLGGAPVVGADPGGLLTIGSLSTQDWRTQIPSAGGAGITNNVYHARGGNPSPQNVAGGAAGTKGTNSGSYRGGGPGGGGGGGPRIQDPGNAAGVGGDGANGPNSAGAAPGVAGAVGGSSPTPNSGAGGGGGSGAAAGNSGTPAGGAGGAGTAGRIKITWVVGGNL